MLRPGWTPGSHCPKGPLVRGLTGEGSDSHGATGHSTVLLGFGCRHSTRNSALFWSGCLSFLTAISSNFLYSGSHRLGNPTAHLIADLPVTHHTSTCHPWERKLPTTDEGCAMQSPRGDRDQLGERARNPILFCTGVIPPDSQESVASLGFCCFFQDKVLLDHLWLSWTSLCKPG